MPKTASEHHVAASATRIALPHDVTADWSILQRFLEEMNLCHYGTWSHQSKSRNNLRKCRLNEGPCRLDNASNRSIFGGR